MSLSPQRVLATAAALCSLFILSSTAIAVTLPPSTWVALADLPGAGRDPVFALAVNPTNDQELIAGSGTGRLFRSTDGGSSWRQVHAGTAGFLTLSYSPFDPAMVVAGTQRGGALISTDGGSHWSNAAGLEGRSVRAFGFAKTLIAAGTDHGVYLSDTGASWTASSLADASVDAVAVAAVNPPVQIFAGGDSGGQGSIPLFQTIDAGATWTPVNPSISGTIVTRLAAGPLPPTGNVRPLVVGTNTGVFISSDDAKSFTPLSGGLLLPSTDFTQIGFTAAHFDRFVVASDGGGGNGGGLWSTADSGQHFASLDPPVPAVTALAVSGDELPIEYVATFRASDHVPALWAYHDTGGTPQGPLTSNTPVATPARSGGHGTSLGDLLRALLGSQIPYLVLGAAAVVLLVWAAVSHLRSRRR